MVPGDQLLFGVALRARVESVSPRSARLIQLRFDATGAEPWSALYRLGRLVQYSYLEREIELGQLQTWYARRPWVVEAPSAGLPLTFGLQLELERRGVAIATVTHAAGLSSTGDATLDSALPLAERFEVDETAAAAVRQCRSAGGRIIAVGTSVVRALEACARQQPGTFTAATGVTDLLIDEGWRRLGVDGLLTGVHPPDSSHFRLLRAFAPAPLLAAANAHAETQGYLAHEFGDSTLILAE